MFKEFFKKIFTKAVSKYSGQCKRIDAEPDTYFYYLASENISLDELDDFLGNYFDYDFYNGGIVIWPEPYNKVYIHKPYFFPYNTYIVKYMYETETILKCYSVSEFKKIYRIV
jgi:hypothetical protein